MDDTLFEINFHKRQKSNTLYINLYHKTFKFRKKIIKKKTENPAIGVLFSIFKVLSFSLSLAFEINRKEESSEEEEDREANGLDPVLWEIEWED